jgi:hypothetical protein
VLDSAGLDEVPMACKNIREVVAAQSDLVTVLGQFDPIAVDIEIDTSAQVGRAVLCPPPFANEHALICHNGAHGVTRPTFTRCHSSNQHGILCQC